MRNQTTRKSAAPAFIRTAYLLELSVGASHVASTLYPASRQASIEEVSENFLVRYGSAHLKGFLLALAEKLDARSNSEGAAGVRRYAMFGAPPEAVIVPPFAVTTKKRMPRAASK